MSGEESDTHASEEDLRFEMKEGYILWYRAILRDNHERVRELCENKTPADFPRLYNYAATKGSFESIKVLYEFGHPWDKYFTVSAARYGHIDILKFAVEKDPENKYNTADWGLFATEGAAFNGHLECLDYSINNGKYIDILSCLWAADLNDHTKIIIYMTQRFPEESLPFYEIPDIEKLREVKGIPG